MEEQIPKQKDRKTSRSVLSNADRHLMNQCTIWCLEQEESPFVKDQKVKPFAKKILARMQKFDEGWRDLTEDKCKKSNPRWNALYKKVYNLFKDPDRLNGIFKKLTGAIPAVVISTEASSAIPEDSTSKTEKEQDPSSEPIKRQKIADN